MIGIDCWKGSAWKELQGDQPAKEKSDIEEGLDRFIDTSELLENRQEELQLYSM